jgi:nucleoside-diphosphate-sugar epimerase
MNEISNTQSNIAKIALFGAAGAIGKSVADALRSRGVAYRVVGRNTQRLETEYGADPLAEIASWTPDDPASTRAAAEDIETLIYLVGVPYDRFDLHPVLMCRTLEGAMAAGVKRIVLIGTVYAYGLPETATIAESHPRSPTTFKGKMRKEQEDILLRAHAEGKIEATILRLPDFYGPYVGDKSLLHLLFKAASSGGAADLVGPIDTPHEFVYVPDVGPVVLDLMARPEAYGKWWNLAGAAVTSQRQIADKVCAMAGRKPKLRVAGKTMIRILGLFNPMLRELVEMHYLQTSPVLLDDRALTDLIGPIHKSSYSDGLRRTFDAYKLARNSN